MVPFAAINHTANRTIASAIARRVANASMSYDFAKLTAYATDEIERALDAASARSPTSVSDAYVARQRGH
jgi:hypothetical protein